MEVVRKEKKVSHSMRNEKTDELSTKKENCLVKFSTETRTKSLQQAKERKKVYTTLQYSASFHCFVEQ